MNVRWFRVAKYALLVVGLQKAVAPPVAAVLDASTGLGFDDITTVAILAYLPFLVGALALLAYRTPEGADTHVTIVAACAIGATPAKGWATLLAVALVFGACALAGLRIGVGLRGSAVGASPGSGPPAPPECRAARGEAAQEGSAPPWSASPWATIWSRPRRTVRRVVEEGRTAELLPLVTLWGTGYALDGIAWSGAGDGAALWAILVLSALLGLVLGALYLYVGGVLLWVFGEFFEGAARPPEVRAAIAWSCVPRAAAALLWVPYLTLFGREPFAASGYGTPGGGPAWTDAALVLLGTGGLADLALRAWAFVLFLNCLAEVHRFSAGRAFAADVLFLIALVLLVAGASIVLGILPG